MKKIRLLTLLAGTLLVLSCARDSEPEGIPLAERWKFMTGDDPAWATPAFNDATWGTIDPKIVWEEQGFKKYNGFAWYRTTVLLRTAIRNRAGNSDSLQLLLGRIDDCDQVFLNGQMIGENGRNIRAGQVPGEEFIREQGRWNLDRRYVLALNDPRIRWDKENLIAVRCYDQGGIGGTFSKPFEVSLTGLRDRLKFDFGSTAFGFSGDTLVTKEFSLINASGTENLRGEVEVTCLRSDNEEILYDERTPVDLAPGDKQAIAVSVRKDLRVPAILNVTFTQALTHKKVTAQTDLPRILTPAVPPCPRINGAKVFGVRSWSPFFFKIAATGQVPLTYRATDLPEGLTLNPANGVITGSLKKRGEYVVKLTVENSLGYAERDLKIVVGDQLSLTPPMGWNSWNCWGLSVSDKKVRQSADAMKQSGLIDHGWTYVNIDDGWEDTHDRDGNILPNAKFPDMAALCNYVHTLGLKIGIYSSPGPRTCGGYEGSYGYEVKDAMTYAAWGIDYLKYDWCSYSTIAPDPTPEQMKKPYRDMKHALRKTNRDIHYSLCQYGMGEVWTWGAEVDGNSWRTTGDIEDTWESLSSIGFSQGACSPWSAPGQWNDPDMLVVGWVGWGPALHYTRLTPEEQYTHLTLWSLLAAPLLIGCDLEQLDAFTLNLLTNDEVIAVNQDPCGKQASPVRKTDRYEVWARDLEDGSKAIGLFNLSPSRAYVPVTLKDLGLTGKWEMRDLWSQTDLGCVRDHFEMLAQPHGARMVVLRKKQM